ncbi:PEP-CTERM sorting domain-containing protein [Haloferula sp.]|uniref:PEP-CTERM sorting domain-containing protein n=1 Tax=Haloferula sp. TaxID=2497595 RepID=UPI003C74460A
MKSKSKTSTITACAAAGLFVSTSSLQAANRTYDGAALDDNWATAGNWGGTKPGAGDNAIINGITPGLRTVNVDTTESISRLWTGTNTTSANALEINILSGGSLSTSVASQLSQRSGSVVMNLNGGSYSAAASLEVGTAGRLNVVNAASTATFQVASGDAAFIKGNFNQSGIVNISAGKITINDAEVGDTGTIRIWKEGVSNEGTVNLTENGTLEVTGLGANTDVVKLVGTYNLSDNAILSMTGGQVQGDSTRLNMTINGSNITVGTSFLNLAGLAGGTFNFNFDEFGVSAFESQVWTHLSGVTINVDGSNYTGGAGVFDLFSMSNLLSEANLANIELTGFSGVEGVDYYYEQSSVDNYSRIVIVPEPSALALLGMAGFGIFLRRRRNA